MSAPSSRVLLPNSDSSNSLEGSNSSSSNIAIHNTRSSKLHHQQQQQQSQHQSGSAAMGAAGGGKETKENSSPSLTSSNSNGFLSSSPHPTNKLLKSNLNSNPSLVNGNHNAHPGAGMGAGESRILERGDSQNQQDHKGSWKSWKKGEGLQPWELDLINNPEVKRKANVAQLYFLNHYFDSLRYLSDRKSRYSTFKASMISRGLQPSSASASSTSSPSSTSASSVSDSNSTSSIAYDKELKSYLGRERVLLRKRRTKLKLNQFHIITQVGQGGYGEVFLARKKESGQVCALKKLRKKVLVKMDEVRHVLTERDILTATRTPWLVRLLYAFQDQDHVFLAMEYVPGGDFRTLLNNSGVLREEHARFYMAEMFVSVNELHKLGYIHRDLKPENFLVDSLGHIKLTDFGLAAGAINPGRIDSLKVRLDQVKDTDLIYRTPHERGSLYKQMRLENLHHADSIVGSPDYMAPEVLRGKNYTISVDYWSLGCIFFEFLSGFPPFSGANPDETWANLKNWKTVLQRPVYTKPQDLQFNWSDVAWDAVTKLIETPQMRYSSISQVQSHAFFSSLNFSTLRETSAPFIPQLEGDQDTGYFDDFENPEDMAKYKEVQEKQRNVEKVSEGGKGNGNRGLWVGFTFGKNGIGSNGKPVDPLDKDATEVFSTMF